MPEAEAGGLGVPDQTGLSSKFLAQKKKRKKSNKGCVEGTRKRKKDRKSYYEQSKSKEDLSQRWKCRNYKRKERPS
jgi:hypothetical protein